MADLGIIIGSTLAGVVIIAGIVISSRKTRKNKGEDKSTVIETTENEEMRQSIINDLPISNASKKILLSNSARGKKLKKSKKNKKK